MNQRASFSNADTVMHVITENIQRSDDPSVRSHDKPRRRECALCEVMGLEVTGETSKFCSLGCYECSVHFHLCCFHKHHNRCLESEAFNAAMAVALSSDKAMRKRRSQDVANPVLKYR
jgi:hypothetical protein